jgi:hypothetical protein
MEFLLRQCCQAHESRMQALQLCFAHRVEVDPRRLEGELGPP